MGDATIEHPPPNLPDSVIILLVFHSLSNRYSAEGVT
jgi:hypothetical protein